MCRLVYVQSLIAKRYHLIYYFVVVWAFWEVKTMGWKGMRLAWKTEINNMVDESVQRIELTKWIGYVLRFTWFQFYCPCGTEEEEEEEDEKNKKTHTRTNEWTRRACKRLQQIHCLMIISCRYATPHACTVLCTYIDKNANKIEGKSQKQD